MSHVDCRSGLFHGLLWALRFGILFNHFYLVTSYVDRYLGYQWLNTKPLPKMQSFPFPLSRNILNFVKKKKVHKLVNNWISRSNSTGVAAVHPAWMWFKRHQRHFSVQGKLTKEVLVAHTRPPLRERLRNWSPGSVRNNVLISVMLNNRI